MELTQLEFVELFTSTVASKAVYLNVLFPSKYRYYFELVSNAETPILIDHPFRLYFPQTVMVEWAPPDGTNGIYITLESSPAFMPFGLLTVQIYIPSEIYNAIVQALSNPINSLADLVPPPDGNACGEVEFVLLSTDAGEQIKIDLVNTSYVPEIPVTVKTLQWREVLYDVMRLLLHSSIPPPSTVRGLSVLTVISPSSTVRGSSVLTVILSPPSPLLTFEFVYTISGDLGITFIDPRYCFLREWIAFPPDWTRAIKDFAGV